tara:strand:- start:48 stop:293 length:246 start_codon:yes stop_codon:yes gene_type:complete
VSSFASSVQVLKEQTVAGVPLSHRITPPLVAVTVQQSLKPKQGWAKLLGGAHIPPMQEVAPSMADAQSDAPMHNEPADTTD